MNIDYHNLNFNDFTWMGGMEEQLPFSRNEILEDAPSALIQKCRLAQDSCSQGLQAIADSIKNCVEQIFQNISDTIFDNFLKDSAKDLDCKISLVNQITFYKGLTQAFHEKKRHWIHYACEAGDLATLSSLKLKEAFPSEFNTPDADGVTPFVLVLRNFHVELFNHLRQEGLEADLSSVQAVKELYLACINGKEDIVHCFLNAPRPPLIESSLLEAALNAKRPAIINLLLGRISMTVSQDLNFGKKLIEEYGSDPACRQFLQAASEPVKHSLYSEWVKFQSVYSDDLHQVLDEAWDLYGHVFMHEQDDKLQTLFDNYCKGLLESNQLFEEHSQIIVKKMMLYGVSTLASFKMCLEINRTDVSGPLARLLSQKLDDSALYSLDENCRPFFHIAVMSENVELIDIFIQRKISPFHYGACRRYTAFMEACARVKENPKLLSQLCSSTSTQKGAIVAYLAYDINHTTIIKDYYEQLGEVLKILFKLRCGPCYYLNSRISDTDMEFGRARGKTKEIISKIKENTFLEFFEKNIPGGIGNFDESWKLPKVFIQSHHLKEPLNQIAKGDFSAFADGRYQQWHDREGNTVLHAACKEVEIDNVVKLLQNTSGWDLYLRNTRGQTFLDVALTTHSIHKLAPLLQFIFKNTELNLLISNKCEICIEKYKENLSIINLLIDHKYHPLAQKLLRKFLNLIFYDKTENDLAEYFTIFKSFPLPIGYRFIIIFLGRIDDIMKSRNKDEIIEMLLNNLPPRPPKDFAQQEEFTAMTVIIKKRLYSLNPPPFCLLAIANHYKILTAYEEKYFMPRPRGEQLAIMADEWKDHLDSYVEGQEFYFSISQDDKGVYVCTSADSPEALPSKLSEDNILLALSKKMESYLETLVSNYSNSLASNSYYLWKNNKKLAISFKSLHLLIEGPGGPFKYKDLAEIHPAEWLKVFQEAQKKCHLMQKIDNYFRAKRNEGWHLMIGGVETTFVLNTEYKGIAYFPESDEFFIFSGKFKENVIIRSLNLDELKNATLLSFQGVTELVKKQLWEFPDVMKLADLTHLSRLENNLDHVISWLTTYDYAMHIPIFNDIKNLTPPSTVTIRKVNVDGQRLSLLMAPQGKIPLYLTEVSFSSVKEHLKRYNECSVFQPHEPKEGPFYTLTEFPDEKLDLTVAAKLPFEDFIAIFDRNYEHPDKSVQRNSILIFVNVLNGGPVIGGDGDEGAKRRQVVNAMAQKLLNVWPEIDLEKQNTILAGILSVATLCLPGIKNELERWLRFLQRKNFSTLGSLDRLLAKALDLARLQAWTTILNPLTREGGGLNLHNAVYLANSLTLGENPVALPPDLRVADQTDPYNNVAKKLLGPSQDLKKKFNQYTASMLLPVLLSLINEACKTPRLEEEDQEMLGSFSAFIRKAVIEDKASETQKARFAKGLYAIEKEQQEAISKAEKELAENRKKLAVLENSYRKELTRYSELDQTKKILSKDLWLSGKRSLDDEDNRPLKRPKLSSELEITLPPNRGIGSPPFLGLTISCDREDDEEIEQVSQESAAFQSMNEEFKQLYESLRPLFILRQKIAACERTLELWLASDATSKIGQLESDLFEVLNNDEKWVKFDEVTYCDEYSIDSMRLLLEKKNILSYKK